MQFLSEPGSPTVGEKKAREVYHAILLAALAFNQ
jgi:hypothetical protein